MVRDPRADAIGCFRSSSASSLRRVILQSAPGARTVDLPSLGLTFDIPFFIFHGSCDQATPIELAEEYFAAIEAPHKEFVRFERCHHFVVMNRPQDFLRELIARVVPCL